MAVWICYALLLFWGKPSKDGKQKKLTCPQVKPAESSISSLKWKSCWDTLSNRTLLTVSQHPNGEEISPLVWKRNQGG